MQYQDMLENKEKGMLMF